MRRFGTGIAVIDAREDFARARRAHLAARAARWLPGARERARAPRALGDEAALPSGVPHLEVIRIAAVVGTVDPAISFDAEFRPASDLVRQRWERIALAHRRGIALPPISVLRRPDGYYVLDGRHRVSVARALGHRDIEAWVTCAQARVPRAA